MEHINSCFVFFLLLFTYINSVSERAQSQSAERHNTVSKIYIILLIEIDCLWLPNLCKIRKIWSRRLCNMALDL